MLSTEVTRMKQNITLAIEKPILREARKLAVRRRSSISQLLSDELEKMVNREAAYSRAKARALAHLDSPPHLGGRRMPDREGLHDRKGLR
jgi:hypothetical protein